MPHDTKEKYSRVTVDFLKEEKRELHAYLVKIGKEKGGQNDFIRMAVKFAINAGLTEITPAPRPSRIF